MTQYVAECRAYGVGFRLRANSARLLELAVQRSPYGSEPGGIPGAFEFVLTENDARYRLERNGSLVTEQKNLTRVLGRLGRELMVHVADMAPEFVFVHAGVVGWQGGALVLPGPSFAGKTTLVSALVRAGATYYSDEYASVDENGWVHPYARELQVRKPGRYAQKGVPVGVFGGHSGVCALPVSTIAFCQYSADAAWSPEAMSPGLTVLELLRHTIPVQRTPQRVLAVLAAMVGGASAIRSGRGDAAEAAEKLMALCSVRAGLR